MPIFDYECAECGAKSEIFVRSDSGVPRCDQCHSSSLTKLISAPSFQLKGTGWYATDFGGKPSSYNKEQEFRPPTKIPEHMEKDFRMNDKNTKEKLKKQGVAKQHLSNVN